MFITKIRQGFAKTSIAFMLGAVGTVAMVTVPAAQAQSNYGAVVGTVTDTTGADIPGA